MRKLTQKTKAKILLLSVFAIVVIIWIINWILVVNFLSDWNNRGTFGDMFGAVNALFSGLAFAGLGVTIYLQVQESKSQESELKNQREQINDQNKNITKQNFESTFFNMIKNIQSICSNMTSPDGMTTGRIYLHELFEKLKKDVTKDSKYQELLIIADDENKSLIRNRVIEIYNQLFQMHSYNLGHFYRSTHNLLKLIENEYHDRETRRKYASIFQAQLSNDELGFILYNSLSDFSLNKDGDPKFHDMVDQLNILENIAEECVFHPSLTEKFPDTNFFFTRDHSEDKKVKGDALTNLNMSSNGTNRANNINNIESKTCKYCKEEIPEDASICRYCKCHQNKFINILSHLNLIPYFILIFLLVLLFFQFKAVEKENGPAVLADKNARIELGKIRIIEKEIVGSKEEIVKSHNDIIKLNANIIKVSSIIKSNLEMISKLTGHANNLSGNDNKLLHKNRKIKDFTENNRP